MGIKKGEKFVAYTDGSCNNLSPYGEGGSAYIIISDGTLIKESSKVFLRTTNNRMELLAILSAMCSVPDGSDIIINTDSKYCICVLSKRQPRRNKPNADLINKCIARMRKLRSIRFVWVKGHNGNEYNELVDHMANEQTELMRKQNGIPVYNYWNSPKVRRSC